MTLDPATDDRMDDQARPFEHSVVVLLVDDQPIIGEAVRRMLAAHEDIAFHFCQDPKEALAKAAELKPTVILQDLIMPDIDGLDLVRDYRAQEATRLTPLIVLSTKEEADTKAEAFARGANDYIVKLPDPLELIARIRYHSRGYIALLERNEAFGALEASERALQDELAKAAKYVRSLLPEPITEPVGIDWRFIPSASLGGDVFDYHRLDDDRFAFYLLDVCGHGVGPALLSISVINVMRARSLPDTDFGCPDQVLAGLNTAFPMSAHNSMFFTMWYGVYRPSTRELTYAGGGHPPSLLVRETDGVPEMQELESGGTLVGIVDGAEFPASTCTTSPGDRLYLYSDGVFEVQRKEDGTQWGFQEYLSFMREPARGGGSKIDDLIAKAREIQGHDAFGDDFSMIEMTF